MHSESGLLSPEELLWGKLECNMEEKEPWANLSNLVLAVSSLDCGLLPCPESYSIVSGPYSLGRLIPFMLF